MYMLSHTHTHAYANTYTYTITIAHTQVIGRRPTHDNLKLLRARVLDTYKDCIQMFQEEGVLVSVHEVQAVLHYLVRNRREFANENAHIQLLTETYFPKN